MEFVDSSSNQELTSLGKFQRFVVAWTAVGKRQRPPSLSGLSRGQRIDVAFADDVAGGLLSEIAELKGASKAELIASIKMRLGV